jgi:hypothetical protein
MLSEIAYFVFSPGTNLHEVFESYQEAWEFSEQYFQDGQGVALVEQFTRRG